MLFEAFKIGAYVIGVLIGAGQSTVMQESTPAACIDAEIAGPAEPLFIADIPVRVAAASISPDTGDGVALNIRFGNDGAEALGRISTDNIGKAVDIRIGDEVVTSPTVREPIWGGKLQISGNFTTEQLEAYVARLNPRCAE